jgi:hypothetical protein
MLSKYTGTTDIAMAGETTPQSTLQAANVNIDM